VEHQPQHQHQHQHLKFSAVAKQRAKGHHLGDGLLLFRVGFLFLFI
jgi:hypothetical protein